MGQAIFLVVLAALLAVGTLWAKYDLRTRGEISDLAEMVLRLLAVVAAAVFLRALSASTWAMSVPALLRLPLGGALAVTGLLSVLLAGRSALPGAGRLVANPVREGFLLIAIAAALVADSLVAMLLAMMAVAVARVLTAAAASGTTTFPEAEPCGERRTSGLPAGGAPDVH